VIPAIVRPRIRVGPERVPVALLPFFRHLHGMSALTPDTVRDTLERVRR